MLIAGFEAEARYKEDAQPLSYPTQVQSDSFSIFSCERLSHTDALLIINHQSFLFFNVYTKFHSLYLFSRAKGALFVTYLGNKFPSALIKHG